jgi:two-component system OmpR family response regulator
MNGVKKNSGVIVVDDDRDTREMISEFLARYDVPTSTAHNLRELNRQIAAAGPSLILLDLSLGDECGLDFLRDTSWCRSEYPVIIITGHRVDEDGRIAGFELGADDYVVKPFSLRELLARIRAVLSRRASAVPGRAGKHTNCVYKFNGWQLEYSSRQLVDPNGKMVILHRSEYALLCAFIESPRRTLSREELMHTMRMQDDVFDRSVDLRVSRLRRKLEANSDTPRMIETRHGAGYIFDTRVEMVEKGKSTPQVTESSGGDQTGQAYNTGRNQG